MKGKSLKVNAILNVIRQLSVIAFPLITFPYISRVLSADNYGKISFGQSIINYFLLIAMLGINSYSIREGAAIRNDKKKFTTFVSEIFAINIIATLISIILFLITVNSVPKLNEYKSLLLIQSISVILTPLTMEWYFSIKEEYAYITVRSLVFQFISVVLMFVFVKEREDYITYAFITVLATGGSAILNFFKVCRETKIIIPPIGVLSKHIKPILILFLNTIMVSIYVNSDLTMLGLLRGDYEVGIYSATAKIYTIIKSIINAIIVVIIPRVSYLKNQGNGNEYKNLVESSLNSLLVILCPAVVGMFCKSRSILSILSGSDFLDGVTSLKVLCVAMVFSILAAFFVNLILLPEKEDKTIFGAATVSAVANLGLNFFFIPILGSTGAAITTLISECVVMFICMIKSMPILRIQLKLRDLISVGVGCVGIVLICVLFDTMRFNEIIKMMLTCVSSIVVYFAVLIVMKHSEVKKILYLLRKRVN